ncbi:thiosulfate oxidation carrier protein SoxY [Methylobacillus sp. Pita2]|uniref:thiosulfate oxidation carrier protein SoxY n=1 Tax=Methylobacillus sp. Pita2 TaxID=3383245 RepID=UPI0038B4AF6E
MKSLTKAGRRPLLQWLAACMLMPWQAVAASWGRPAMEAGHIGPGSQPSDQLVSSRQDEIEIVVPASAEDGTSIQVEIMSRLPGTEAIALFAEKNAVPLLANFTFSHGAQPYVVTRIRLAQSQSIEVVVKANGMYYKASRYIAVANAGAMSDVRG